MPVEGVQMERRMTANWDGLVFTRLVGGAKTWGVSIPRHVPRLTPENLRTIADKLEAADREAGDIP